MPRAIPASAGIFLPPPQASTFITNPPRKSPPRDCVRATAIQKPRGFRCKWFEHLLYASPPFASSVAITFAGVAHQRHQRHRANLHPVSGFSGTRCSFAPSAVSSPVSTHPSSVRALASNARRKHELNRAPHRRRVSVHKVREHSAPAPY